MPTVSIIVPTYERLGYLKEAVASVLAQTFTDWELIVVDDGSTDGTVEWLESLDDARVIVIANERTGNVAALRNRGVARGTGAWIAFLDSDDLWGSDKLALQLAALAEHSERRWSCTGVSFIDDKGAAIAQRAGVPYYPHSGWILEKLLTFAAAATLSTLLVSRSLFYDVGGFDETIRYREDYELELRLAARAEIHAVADPLTIMRQHRGRSTDSQRVADLHRINESVFRRFGDTTQSPRIRAICRRQCSLQLVQQARLHSLNGDHRTALKSAAKAIRDAPLTILPWRSLAGCTLRAFRPK